MPPKDIGPGATAIASEALNALVSLRGLPPITVGAFTQALVVDPAFVVIAAAALIAWGRI